MWEDALKKSNGFLELMLGSCVLSGQLLSTNSTGWHINCACVVTIAHIRTVFLVVFHQSVKTS